MSILYVTYAVHPSSAVTISLFRNIDQRVEENMMMEVTKANVKETAVSKKVFHNLECKRST